MDLRDIPATLEDISAGVRRAADAITPYLGKNWRPEPDETVSSLYARYCNFVIECPDTRLSFYYWKILVKARLRDEGKLS